MKYTNTHPCPLKKCALYVDDYANFAETIRQPTLPPVCFVEEETLFCCSGFSVSLKLQLCCVFFQDPLFLDLLGTCHSEANRPAVLQYKHIQRYRLHVERGLSFTPPEVTVVLICRQPHFCGLQDLFSGVIAVVTKYFFMFVSHAML